MIVDVGMELGEHEPRPHVVAGDEALESFDVVAAAPSPGDVAKIEPVVDPEVGEGHEVLLIDGIPQPQLGGNAVVEPVQMGRPSLRSGVAVRPSSSIGAR